jgi:probable F420-dependent oxidoreductase
VTSSLSVVVPLWQDRPGSENLEVAALASQLGYRRLWIGEMATYDAFALATAIGMSAPFDLTIGPLAVGVRTATTMAMGVASVSDLIGRPVAVAIGASSPVVVGQWHGRPWHRTTTHMVETATLLRALLDGERSSQDGDLSASHGFRLRLAAPGAHVTLAAFGERSLAAAVRVADRIVVNMASVAAIRRIVDSATALAERAGVPRPPLAAWLVAAADPTPEGRAQMAAARASYLAAPGYAEIITEAGFGGLVEYARTRPHPRELAAAIPPGLDEELGLVGPGGALAERVCAYLEAGVDEICLVPVTAGDPGGRRTMGALADHPGIRA